MFNMGRKKTASKSDIGVETPALPLESKETSMMDVRPTDKQDQATPLLRSEDLQRSTTPASGDTLLGNGCRFEGNLTFDGTVQIDGEFIGTIESSGHLVISAGARVDGTVTVGSAVISGAVNGKVTTTGSLELLHTAHVDGELNVQALVVAKGAHFQGSVKMGGVR